MSSNPLEQVGNISVELATDSSPSTDFWPLSVTPIVVDSDKTAPRSVQPSPLPIDSNDECSYDQAFPGVSTGDFSEVEVCLDRKASGVDLVTFIDQADDAGDCEMASDFPFLFEDVLMTDDEPVKIDATDHHIGSAEMADKQLSRQTDHDALNMSPGTPAEAVDQAGLLPSLQVLMQQQHQRLTACPPQLNSFDAQPPPEVPDAALVTPPTPTALPKPTAPQRRRAIDQPSGQQKQQKQSNREKSYLAMCQKNRIFDSNAKAKYQMELELSRDVIVERIVRYVKHCLGPERDRVHRFLMVMLVDGQTESGPYWRFFQDAVYFCDASKKRVPSQPCKMFHIRQSAYVGLLWGKYKGNECFDYATLGDAIKSVKSKYNGGQYFVDPDFGSSGGKPKRLFQFGPSAFGEIIRYYRQCSAE